MPEEKEILDKVWNFLNCKVEKPEITLRRQHSTALYWPKEHKITVREDSWNIMMPAEKKLTVFHEAVHACKIPHQPGFRTSIDNLSKIGYKELWGEDKDLIDFENKTKEVLNKIRSR